VTKTTLLVLATLAWPALNLAQTTPEKITADTDATNPAAPVSALRYHSVLEHSPRGVAQGTDDWPAANARVGRFARGHTDILKAEQAQDAHPPAKPGSPAPGANP